jgi:signal transduction histidine kinase
MTLPGRSARRSTRTRGSGLPLTVWAALLCGGAVLVVAGSAGAFLHSRGELTTVAWEALSLGTAAGLVLVLLAVVGASRLAAGLRGLHSDAVARLTDPGAPVGRVGSRRVAARASTELAELARTLDALHLRVRLADDLGERHRREAETAGAGVFELLSGLVAAEEGARGQLAAELHDTVAQSLMIARGLLATNPSTPQEMAKLGDYVEDAEEQVRAVMARTRPPALREGDLASAVGGLRLDMEARYGLRVHVTWPESPYPLPLASAVTVYRFFQEALLNVVKHADVDDAHVSLLVEEDAVVAAVRDEGPGFDPAAVRPDRGRHVGLGLLRERARLSGGGLDVDSRPGEGTTLTLRLPRPSAAVAPLETALPVPTQVEPVERRNRVTL